MFWGLQFGAFAPILSIERGKPMAKKIKVRKQHKARTAAHLFVGDQGRNQFGHRVERSKKAYTRKKKHRKNLD